MENLRTKVEDYYSGMRADEYVVKESEDVVQLYFLCPGCRSFVSVANIKGTDRPWHLVDVVTLTVRESILHTAPDGCGWHGYLTRGEFHLDSRAI